MFTKAPGNCDAAGSCQVLRKTPAGFFEGFASGNTYSKVSCLLCHYVFYLLNISK